MLWRAGVAVLLAPSLLVWLLRGAALAARCAPGPGACHGIALGAGFRDTLSLSWLLGTNTPVMIAIALVASIAALIARRPLLAAATLLLLPLTTLILPMLAVASATYPGCTIDEGGVGDCTLWGAQMGMAFHDAASVTWLIYGFAPYTFSLALMIGVVGLFLARMRPMGHATANPHGFPDERFSRRD